MIANNPVQVITIKVLINVINAIAYAVHVLVINVYPVLKMLLCQEIKNVHAI